MHFTLQDMVRQVAAEADMREKLAQAEEETKSEEAKKKEKKAPPAQASNGNESTAPERNEEGVDQEKVSSVYVEKLASAVEYLNVHFLEKEAVGKPEPPLSHKPPTTTVGSGIGATAMPNTIDAPTPGTQNTETGQATPQQQAPLNPGPDPKSPGQTNPATALETTIQDPPGGSEDWTNKDVQKQAQVQRVLGIMKRAENALNPATNSAGREPLENPNASQAEEGVPSQPGEVSKQETMVGSNQSAIDYTKQQAKAVPKARMGEVLDEPAQKKSTDPVLHNVLDATSQAGVKLSSVEKRAAARAWLRKIAEEGAAPNATPEQKEKASKLQEVMKAKAEEKKNGDTSESKDEEEEKTSGFSMPLSGGY
jgi:hypothetical protein